MLRGIAWDGGRDRCIGLMQVRPNGSSCAGNRVAVRGLEWWKPVNSKDLDCLWYLNKSEALELSALFNNVLQEFWSAFLSCLTRGAFCGLLDVDWIDGIPFDDNVGMYWVGWKLGMRGALWPAGCHNPIDRIVCKLLPGFWRRAHWGTAVKVCILTWIVRGATFTWWLNGVGEETCLGQLKIFEGVHGLVILNLGLMI